jgi:eukaryotic-like serine/threonine-protein kinase
MSERTFSQGEIVIIGRDPSCECPVSGDPKVSRQQMVLVAQSGRLNVRDLNSTNGTFVNGVRHVRCILNPGDRLTCGESTEIVWSIDPETSSLVVSVKRKEPEKG